MYTLRDVCRRDSGESYTCARPTGQRGLRTPAFGADTVTGREEPVRHVVRGPFGFLGPRPARPAVNIHSFSSKVGENATRAHPDGNHTGWQPGDLIPRPRRAAVRRLGLLFVHLFAPAT